MARPSKPGSPTAPPAQGAAVRDVTVRDVAARAGVSAGSVSRALNGVGGVSPGVQARVRQAAEDLGYDRAGLRSAGVPARMSDIAAHAGVSVGSVSRALKSLGGVSAATRQRVLQAAGELGYDLGKLRAAPITRLGVLVHRGDNALSSNLFYAPVLHGAEQACRSRKLAMVYSTAGSGESLNTLVVDQQLDGLLCVGYFEDELLGALRAAGKPLVLVDHFAGELPSVNSDNFGGAYAATTHLLQQGRQRVAFIGGQREHFSIAERRRGYLQALADAGRPHVPALDVRRDPPEQEEGARTAMLNLLALVEPPDAVFAFNDSTAIVALRTCQQAGLRVPQDIALVGFDDIDPAASLHPALSTVRVPKEALGARGVELLLELPDAPAATHIVVPSELIVRASSAGHTGPTRRRVGALRP
ncbi:substrate-binding domain-containing protein [Deinococcus alpinitundrae]|uniref:substrate-binding domain-containing protein n=1 Tax=Deinococcus alpinitundrae TaxID=468913 RepID=UPI0013796712|nr:substrate-binding domain-containing protein [Deinococcus alpinitundrae]